VEIADKSSVGAAVQKAFLKNDSIGKLLTIAARMERGGQTRKIRVKLEIDCRPPAGSQFTTSYLTFPTVTPLTTQTLESSFALKLHALFCRQYVKGRDWFDLIWYVSRRPPVSPNFRLLKNALAQTGPWAGEKLAVDAAWVRDALAQTIRKINWNVARQDVQRFLPLSEQAGLQNWKAGFFLQLAGKII
jgi:hypothetical protein